MTVIRALSLVLLTSACSYDWSGSDESAADASSTGGVSGAGTGGGVTGGTSGSGATGGTDGGATGATGGTGGATGGAGGTGGATGGAGGTAGATGGTGGATGGTGGTAGATGGTGGTGGAPTCAGLLTEYHKTLGDAQQCGNPTGQEYACNKLAVTDPECGCDTFIAAPNGEETKLSSLLTQWTSLGCKHPNCPSCTGQPSHATCISETCVDQVGNPRR